MNLSRRGAIKACRFVLGILSASLPVFASVAWGAALSIETRRLLTVEELFNGRFPQIVENRAFLPIGPTQPAVHELSGTLVFPETEMTTQHPSSDWKGGGQTLFPAFSLPILSHEGNLIPLERGIILSGEKRGSFWNIIVGPGRVWREAGDNGYSRGSFPFTLTDNAIGQARNGVAAFVFNAVEISPVAIQITQETAPVDGYERTDFWASLPAGYVPADFPERERHIRELREELDSRLPVRPWNELPDADVSSHQFNSLVAASDVSAAALLMDGVLYRQSVPTRSAGPHPYPYRMRHGVFSVTKTLCLGLSMFYVAQRYGSQVFTSLVTDHVPELAGHPGWSDVTFENTLDMATGTQGNDTGPDILSFVHARSAANRLQAIHDLPDALPRPGESFNYASTNSFVLSYALNRYVQAREGPEADYWLMLKRDVLGPLGIQHLPVSRPVEPDGSLGTPMMGWGSYPTVDEAAKIAKLLDDEGRFRGQQLLHPEKVRDALHRTSRPPYEAGGQDRYLHSVWLRPADAGPCRLEVPAMNGHGGNVVAFLPSGVIAIRFADANNYDLSPLASAAERYRSSCR